MSTSDTARSAPQPKRLGWLRTCLLWALIADILAEAGVAATGWRMLDYFSRRETGDFASHADAVNATHEVQLLFDASAIASTLASLACLIFYGWFLFRAAANLVKANVRHFNGTAIGALAGHVIPVVSLYKPALTMAAIWRNTLDPAQAKVRAPATVWIWWMAWNLANLVWMVATLFQVTSGANRGAPTDLDAYAWSVWLQTAEAALLALSAGCLILVSTTIARAQDELFARPSPPA